ncbi:hypothetical protein R1flu_015648 [Riccia fluitans]|uniref:Uncharacterized protein n=1 Tax=Riccia fluitans TaxID=41844 RepID=A0ABD1YJM3_9MARC
MTSSLWWPHRSPQLFYEHLKSIFDSYVNLDNNPDVQPLVKGLDAEDFDVDAFLGTNMGGRKEEMTPDFLDGLFVHDVRRLESEIENIRWASLSGSLGLPLAYG